MKKWTVMLIPHDRGGRRSFDLSAVHIWSLIAFMVVLSFASGFFFKRNQVARADAEEFKSRYRALERSVALHAPVEAPSVDNQAAVRAEYEARDTAITTELSRLYDLEKEVRIITGLPPRDAAVTPLARDGGGKGGPPTGLGETPDYTDDALMWPPEIIYGLSRPSADLIVQEIDLRSESLQQLLQDMEAQRERIARTPSIWPTTEPKGYISSRYGRRKDPFTRRVRHHDGLDISTRSGTPLQSTARGVVTAASKDRYLGNVIVIDHGNGVATSYAHMRERLVEKGDQVERGDIIGTVGNTGRSTGSHVHYEVHVDGKSVNPKKYLGH